MVFSEAASSPQQSEQRREEALLCTDTGQGVETISTSDRLSLSIQWIMRWFHRCGNKDKESAGIKATGVVRRQAKASHGAGSEHDSTDFSRPLVQGHPAQRGHSPCVLQSLEPAS